MQRRSFEWRLAMALGAPLPLRVSPAPLLPLFLVVSIIVLIIAPRGTTALLAPGAGTLGLAIEWLYLSRLVFRIHLALLRLRGKDTPMPSNLRRCLFSAINALFGLLVFVPMFYPLSHAVIGIVPGSGAGRLLWMLTVGGAIVTLAFGQMVSLLLDAIQSRLPAAPAD